jgi:hypothetical protein
VCLDVWIRGGVAVTYVDPVTSQDWRDVASERQSDAATLYAGSRGVGALYFFGFVVESYAKALCVAEGKSVPRGPYGHDIIAILDRAGVGRAVLPAAVRKFAESRDVGLRYQVSLPKDVDLGHELDCAQRLARWCVRRLNRPTRRRR